MRDRRDGNGAAGSNSRLLQTLGTNDGRKGRTGMVRPERFELPTCCSGGNRSIQLSYGRTDHYSLHG